MKWLVRLKTQKVSTSHFTESTNPGFVGFVGPTAASIEKTDGDLTASKDANPDPDRWCYPNSGALNANELDTFTARLALFTERGLSLTDGELLADMLLKRHREQDDRTICLECTHLQRGWRCGNWQRAGVARASKDAQLPSNLVYLLQYCDGFGKATTRAQLNTRHPHGDSQ
jgi:hypothetical protein